MKLSACAALVIVAVLGLGGCAAQRQVQTPVPEMNLAEPLPAVAASFTTRLETQHGHRDGGQLPGPQTWRFFRETDSVEIEDLQTQSGEFWQRDGGTQFLFKLFHADGKGIEYRMDDLEMLEISRSWQQHALLIEPELLQSLALVETGWRDGYPFRRFKGEVAGSALEITWRLDLNLPLQIRRGDGGHVEITELTAAYPLAESPWVRRNRTGYDIIDYADLGDRESDPFVARVQGQLPGGHVHRH